MKQTDYPVPAGSMLVAGMVSDAIVGAITGMTAVRRLIFRIILFVAITVAAVSFTIGMLFRDYLPEKPAPTAQAESPAQGPAKSRQTKPPPRERDDTEEIQHLIRKDPL
jgi:hypothetical protein